MEKRLSITVPLDIHRALKIKAAQDDQSMNEIVLNAVKEYLQKSGDK